MLVCVEGPTGGGKSKLVESFPASFRRCPEICHFAGGFPTCGPGVNDIERNFLAYLAGEILASKMISSHACDWIQDRNWISQLTFLLALAKTSNIPISSYFDQVACKIIERELVVPHQLIYIRCSPNLTAMRRTLRGSSEWGDVPSWIIGNKKSDFRETRLSAYDYVFLHLPLNVVEFDGQSDLDFNFVSNRIVFSSETEPPYEHLAKSIRELVNYGKC